MAKSDLDAVRTAPQSLRNFWRSGRRSLARLERLRRRRPDEYRYGNKQEVLKNEAAREGMNYDSLQKAWRVAQLYEEHQIDSLCALVEKHRAPFGATHLLRILSVPQNKRQSFTREAIRERWSITELDAVIRERFGQRRHGGRRPRVPSEPGGKLVYLDALCAKWCRWCEAALPSLPQELQREIVKTSKTVDALKKIVVEKLNKTRSNERPRRKC